MAWSKAARDAAALTRKMHAKAIERTSLSKETRQAGAAAFKLARKTLRADFPHLSLKERNAYVSEFAGKVLGRKTKSK